MLRVVGVGVIAALSGCGQEHSSTVGDGRDVVAAQRLRTSWQGPSLFLGIGVQVTNANGAAVPCDEGELAVEVAWSDAGAAGPFTDVDGADVVRVCEAIGGDVALVLDNSKSVTEEMDDIRGAAHAMLDGVVAAGGRASLVRVSTNAEVLSGLGDDGDAIGVAIDALYPSNGWTALWDGVRMGNETLGAEAVNQADDLASFCDTTARAGVVAFTDGEENNSSDEQEYDHDQFPGDGIDTTLEDLFDLQAGGATTPVYTVGMGDEVDELALDTLSADTGGRYLHVDDSSEVGEVFDLVGDYFTSNQQICAEIPTGTCGPLWVKVSWEYTDPTGTVVAGSTVQPVTVDCPADPTGNQVVVLLTLSNPGIAEATAAALATNAVSWASSVIDPKVLVVLDENHHGEFDGDADYVADLLDAAGVDATRYDEIDGGITTNDLEGFDVVWYSNPGYPMDDFGSFESLQAFGAAGGGLVLQGDDMAWSWGGGFLMSPLTHLDFHANGTSFCGEWTDNNQGAEYLVTISSDAHPVIAGLEGQTFLYGDDIDTSVARGEGETVLATATLDGGVGCDTVPVVLAWEP